jgi:N-acetylglucosaminyl-diphospho-decaprenol L-rhamnosyltransferase
MASNRNGSEVLADLAVVVVSTNEVQWLERCLSTVFERAGSATLDVIVVDNDSTDGTRELVETRFPQARVVSSPNRGFAHGNNRGLEQARARYSLLLNPDTEVIGGTFGELVGLLDARPGVGVAGVCQVKPDGTLCRSIHRFPTFARALGEALFSERWPVHPAWAGERELNPDAYRRECECDWPTGSFMLVRREALLSVGLLDERFFLQCEEPDLCLRVKRAGWQVRYLPQMTVVHHSEKAGVQPRMVAQDTYARKQYARKHFNAVYGDLYIAARCVRHLVRAFGVRRGAEAVARRNGARRALLTLLGRIEPPFGPPPATAIQSPPATAMASPPATAIGPRG